MISTIPATSRYIKGVTNSEGIEEKKSNNNFESEGSCHLILMRMGTFSYNEQFFLNGGNKLISL